MAYPGLPFAVAIHTVPASADFALALHIVAHPGSNATIGVIFGDAVSYPHIPWLYYYYYQINIKYRITSDNTLLRIAGLCPGSLIFPRAHTYRPNFY
jgi:hypothetical protein